MRSKHRQTLGHSGESIAADFLEKKGYSILDRNYRTSYGEIDLIASQDEIIIFNEVKTRASSTFGPPEISITRRKAEHMRYAAESYIQEHPDLRNDWRIDVISVQLHINETTPLIVHFENAIT